MPSAPASSLTGSQAGGIARPAPTGADRLPPAPARWLAGLICSWLAFLLCLPAQAQDEPPGRVGRIAQASGAVSLQQAGSDSRLEQARQPLQNWPVSQGDQLSTGAGARLEIDIGSTRLRLGEQARLDIVRLDDDRISLRLQRGSLSVWLRNEEVARELSVQTPIARIEPLGASLFRVDVKDPRSGSDSVTTWRASVRIEQEGASLRLNPGQRAELFASGGWRLGTPQSDGFAGWAMHTDEPATAGTPPLGEMTGADDLARYGQWNESEEYGWVWAPRAVDRDWAPYRQGRWAWVDPWGWTWVDQAAWGFAPFHYGRWVIWRGRWNWVPGLYQPRPVYAPALVVWSGRPGNSLSFTIGPGVSWFPLAPREVYVPYYRAGPRYLNEINQPHGMLMPAPRLMIERPDQAVRDGHYRYRDSPAAISHAPSPRTPPVWRAPELRNEPRPETRWAPPADRRDDERRSPWPDPRQERRDPPAVIGRPAPQPQPQTQPAQPAPPPANQGAPGGRWSAPVAPSPAPAIRYEPGNDEGRHQPDRRHHDDTPFVPAPAPTRAMPAPVQMMPAPVQRIEPPRAEAPRMEPPRQRFEPAAPAPSPAPQGNAAPPAPPANPGNPDGRAPRFRRNAE